MFQIKLKYHCSKPIKLQKLLHVVVCFKLLLIAGWFLGCFKEKPEERVFNISAGNYRITDTSAQECTSACDHLNQTYAATEGDLCFCASGSYDKYGQASNESLCNLNCSDGVSCNNISYIRVYDTQGSVGGLNIDAPQIGWLWQELNFSASLEEGIETFAGHHI